MGLFHVANFQGTYVQSLGQMALYLKSTRMLSVMWLYRLYSSYYNYTMSVYLGTFISTTNKC